MVTVHARPVTLALASVLLAGCAGQGAPGASAGSTASGTAAPASSSALAPSRTASPPPAPSIQAQPMPAGTSVGVLPDDIPGAIVALYAENGGLFVETEDAVLVLDPATATVRETIPLPDVPQINDWLLTDDSLWATDHDNGAIVRVDRRSGEQVARIELPLGRAVSLVETREGIWAGGAHDTPEYVILIDPETNEAGRMIEQGAYPTTDGTSLWFGRDQWRSDPSIRQVAPASGEVLQEINLRNEEGCYVGGAFPEIVWSWCFEPWPDETTATRLDVEGGAVVAEVELGESGGLVGVHGDSSWFFAEPLAGKGPPLALRVSNESNQIAAAYEMPIGPWVIHDGNLWLLMPDTRELMRHDPSDL